jgi:hypothetical protein
MIIVTARTNEGRKTAVGDRLPSGVEGRIAVGTVLPLSVGSELIVTVAVAVGICVSVGAELALLVAAWLWVSVAVCL